MPSDAHYQDFCWKDSWMTEYPHDNSFLISFTICLGFNLEGVFVPSDFRQYQEDISILNKN